MKEFLCNGCFKFKKMALLEKVRANNRKICRSCWESMQKARKLREVLSD